jgi:hypothetical protein
VSQLLGFKHPSIDDARFTHAAHISKEYTFLPLNDAVEMVLHHHVSYHAF